MSTTNVATSNEVTKRSAWNKTNINDLIGKTFGYLTILSGAECYIKPNGSRETRVLCECKCGRVKSYIIHCLKNGHTKSCGCFKVEQLGKASITHGQSRVGKSTLEYRVWTGIKARTTNSNVKAFKDYGGRGILMCQEWLNSFETFLIDMGKIPSQKHSIERRKVNEGYNKENCYWANRHQQMANRRNSNKNVGVCWDKGRNKWKSHLNVNKITVLNKHFDTEQEAIQARKAAELKYNIYQ